MSNRSGLSDLDELILKCRDAGAKAAFSEAVAAYRAGAYRAAIVSTWIAVTFDYLAKLRDLDVGGNQKAKTILGQFETARANSDVTKSLELERNILDDAKDTFELLTPLEMVDLDRLKDDRHRCAHPSLQSIDSPYAPTAELVRMHMRNAIEHMLGRPPLQGKEALNSIWGDITSELFPEDLDGATDRLKMHIPRARETLVSTLLVKLIKGLISPNDEPSHGRYSAAIEAIVGMHHEYSERLLREKLSPLLMGVDESDLSCVVSLLGKVPVMRVHVDSIVYTKLRIFVGKCADDNTLINAARVPELRPGLETEPVSDKRLVVLLIGKAESHLLEKLVQKFEQGTDFSSFKTLRGCLRLSAIPIPFSDEQLLRFVKSLSSNKELRRYGGYSDLVIEAIKSIGDRLGVAKEECRTLYSLLEDACNAEARKALGARFPDFAVQKVVDSDNEQPLF
jgi:hypothetical protein